LLKPERSAGGHRLYTDDDLRILLFVRQKMGEGHSIGAIARRGRQSLLTASRTEVGQGHKVEQARAPNPVVLGPWGSHRSFLPELEKTRDALVRAAIDIDPDAVQQAVERAFALVEPSRAVNEVLIPGATAIGELWAEGRCPVAGEHLVTVAIQDRVRQLIAYGQLAIPSNAPEVLVACFPGEQHNLPALLVAMELSNAGFRTVWLGGALPLTDLEVVLDARAPTAVVLSVTLPHLYRLSRTALRELLVRRPGLRLFVGGRGSPSTDASLERLGLSLGVGNLAEGLQAERTQAGA